MVLYLRPVNNSELLGSEIPVLAAIRLPILEQMPPFLLLAREIVDAKLEITSFL